MTPPHIDFDRPFTRSQLRAAGVDLSILRHVDFCCVLRGAWIRRTAWDGDTRIRAALLIHPASAAASHYSAARLLGLPVPENRFEHVVVSRPKDRRHRPEIKSHCFQHRRPVVRVRGIPATAPIATFIDLAGMLPLVDLVVLGDALVKKWNVRPQELTQACRRSTEHHAGTALAAALFVRKGVDSPNETRLRMLLVLAGLPEPEVNHVVRHADGSWKRRYDLWYAKAKLVVEYDGRQHAVDAKQWTGDLERREEMDDADVRILVVTSEGIFDNPSRTIQRVRRRLLLRGAGPLPPRSDSWKPYFAA